MSMHSECCHVIEPHDGEIVVRKSRKQKILRYTNEDVDTISTHDPPKRWRKLKAKRFISLKLYWADGFDERKFSIIKERKKRKKINFVVKRTRVIWRKRRRSARDERINELEEILEKCIIRSTDGGQVHLMNWTWIICRRHTMTQMSS